MNSSEVAEQAIAMMIGVGRNLFTSSNNMASGHWQKDGGTNFTGKTVSVIGCGFVGAKVARLSRAFSCRVLVVDILDKTDFCQEVGATQVDLREALTESDYMSLHVPLTEQTKSMINETSLSMAKEGLILVNTSRGEVLDLEAARKCVELGRLRGLGLDVYVEEPFSDKGLFLNNNIHGTCHVAGNSEEAVWKMGQAALDGIAKFLLDH